MTPQHDFATDRRYLHLAVGSEAAPPATLLAAAGWAVAQAGRLLIVEGREPAGERLLALGAPDLADLADDAGWMRRLQRERSSASSKARRGGSPRSEEIRQALIIADLVARAARDHEPSMELAEQLLLLVRLVERRRILAITWRVSQERPDLPPVDVLNETLDRLVEADDLDDEQRAGLWARGALPASQSRWWAAANAMARPAVRRQVRELVWALQTAADLDLLPTTGPGRPQVGPATNVRFDVDLLQRLDEYAEAEGLTRAAAIRRLVADGLGGT